MPYKKSKQLSKNPTSDLTRTLLKRVQNFAHAHALWRRGERIVIGVSGGPDSVCLAHLFAALRKKYNFTLHIVHINYRLRGTQSNKDEAYVRSLGKSLDIPISVYHPHMPKNPSEDALRRIRYARFESVRKRLGFATIAVGHTKNDQAETLLLHLLRGTGLRGLSGMLPKNGSIIRPLLEISRDEILADLDKNRIPYQTDETNTQPIYTRNTIRLKLLPYLTRNFQPNIVDILARSAANIAADYAYIQESAPNIGVHFSASALIANPAAIQNMSLRMSIQQALGSDIDITDANIREVLKMCRSVKSKTQTVTFHGLKFMRKGDTVTLQINK